MTRKTQQRRRELNNVIDNCNRAIARFEKTRNSWPVEKYDGLIAWYSAFRDRAAAELAGLAE